MRIKHWAAFFLLALSWGSSYFWIKLALREVAPITLVSLRVLFGALGLCCIMVLSRQKLPRDWSLVLKICFLGIISVAAPFFLLTWGETRINSSLTGVLNSTVPLFTILLAHFFLPHERISAPSIGGIMLGFAGVMLLMTRQGAGNATHQNGGSQMLGACAVVLASVIYAIGAIYAKKYVLNVAPVVQATIVMIAADATLWVMHAMAFRGAAVPLPSEAITWAALIWLGLVGSCLAYLLYFYLLSQWGASRVSLVMYVCPIVAVLMGFAFLHESLDARFFLGASLVLGGLCLSNYRFFRKAFRI